jgi:beta-lactamase class A
MKRGIILISLLLGAVVGSIATLFFDSQSTTSMATSSERGHSEIRMGQKGFVNPLLDCPMNPTKGSTDTQALKLSIQDLIVREESKGDIQVVSVFFDDLSREATFGLSAEDHYIGASLMKLPVLIGVLKKTSSDPQLLQKKLVFDPTKLDTKVFGQSLSSTQPMEPNTSYSVEELLRRSIIDSDNIATNLLLASFPDLDVLEVSNQVGVTVLMREDGNGWVSLEKYSRFYRTLYNSTYLDSEKSNWALNLLSKSQFHDGLVAGVSPGIPVAHKFAERSENGIEQFHDCGIIYYPAHPYILCVMTRGKNQKHQIQTTAHISKAVFEHVKQEVQ